MKKVAFILNGSKKCSQFAQKVIEDCQQSKLFATVVLQSTYPKHAIALAKKCTDDEMNVIVAVGGDGTANEVLNGIMLSKNKAPVLGVLASGTGNDFVKSIPGYRESYSLRVAIEQQRILPIDILQVTSEHEINYCLNITDIGFGGKVIALLNEQRKFIRGGISYGLAILRAFVGFKRPHLIIESDTFKYDGETMMIAICNGSTFGNGLIIHPSATIQDGKIGITLLGKVSLMDYVRNLKLLKSGEQIIHPQVNYYQCSQLTIQVKSGNALGEMDGELLRDVNINIQLLPQRIQLLQTSYSTINE